MSQIVVELQDFMGDDKSICNAAWTSTYDKDKRDVKYDDEAKVAALVPRLIRDGHATPIESVIMRFWIKVPIFVDRQVMTHRLQSSSGLSSRYRTMPNDWFKMLTDVVDIINKVEQGNNGLDFVLTDSYEYICSMAYSAYAKQIAILKESQKDGKITNQEYKRIREIIRGMLPVAGMTERTTIMNLRSFANFQKQRNSEYAQPETRLLAQKMLEVVEQAGVAPIAVKTLKEMGWKI